MRVNVSDSFLRSRNQDESEESALPMTRSHQCAKTRRCSSYAVDLRNGDAWVIGPGEQGSGDIKGRVIDISDDATDGCRECLFRMTGTTRQAERGFLREISCPGTRIVNSFQSMFFTASTSQNNRLNAGCVFNCYAPMLFRRALIELDQ